MSREATRTYTKRKRARREAETRQRITDAVMELHRTVGPANTTVTEVAERAGVSRMTVYNHFPTDAELIGACSADWASRNPFPDPEAWAAVADPGQRLAGALVELYRWYRETEDMMGKVLRDAPLVPALEEVMNASWWAYVDRVVETLATDREIPGEDGKVLEAALRLAVDFHTWRTLTRSGLDDETAAAVGARAVEALTG